ncbi:zgc:171566 isoform X2 [Syngnathoides biaculeatus]|uniref:zgc:171566 isoform X2 n=1 Tax=Syngnathoides biaculeatus TaxID=300417 RepID=UPI002ADDB603|nr:zgc:171566 isoform X2 [Syngnathoides biaculeatus]
MPFAVPAVLLAALLSSAAAAGERPIIGVLAQEVLPDDPFAAGWSYIAASYVKYLESGGARVVPVRINRTQEEYAKIFSSINGLLLPGGDVDIETSQYARAAQIFYDLALKANNDGDYFPLWGTCQGFQQLTVLTASKNLLTTTDTKAVALPLTFTSASPSSRLFRDFPEDLMRSLSEDNITVNFHSWSLSLQNFSRNAKLKRFYKVLSTNTDGRTDFVSTMEARRYPFYAVQWHPEKAPFEWVDKPGAVHSTQAVRASFYAASFFVSEASKSRHKFLSPSEEERALIYNFAPVFAGLDAIFVQIYYFD